MSVDKRNGYIDCVFLSMSKVFEILFCNSSRRGFTVTLNLVTSNSEKSDASVVVVEV